MFFPLCIFGVLLFSLHYQGCVASHKNILDQGLELANSQVSRFHVGPDFYFKTIQSAIDAIPLQNDRRYIIKIAAGTYREKITVPVTKDYITLLGDKEDKFGTVIVYNHNAGTAGRTFNSSTFAVEAKYFIAQYITFKNDAPFAANGAVNGQAVALRVSGDYAAFYDCFITSSQDTLYDDKGRHYYKRTYIQGNVDFIFGIGRTIYEECTILSNSRSNSGTITAQGKKNASDVSGYAIFNSFIGGTGMAELGRPWKSYASVVFVNNYMDEAVNLRGWDSWNYNPNDKTVYFGEYGNFGPGADLSQRPDWLYRMTEQEAYSFVNPNYINGTAWLYWDHHVPASY